MPGIHIGAGGRRRRHRARSRAACLARTNHAGRRYQAKIATAWRVDARHPLQCLGGQLKRSEGCVTAPRNRQPPLYFPFILRSNLSGVVAPNNSLRGSPARKVGWLELGGCDSETRPRWQNVGDFGWYVPGTHHNAKGQGRTNGREVRWMPSTQHRRRLEHRHGGWNPGFHPIAGRAQASDQANDTALRTRYAPHRRGGRRLRR